MKTKQGFLTVREFAKQKGVTLATIYKWVREDRLPGIVKCYGEITLIPESYLTLEIKRGPQGRPPGPTKSPPPLLTREEKFDKMRKIKSTFSELQQLFEEGKTFREIGDMNGVSFQAIQSIYKRHFEHLMLPGWERRKAIIEKEWERRYESHLNEVERLAILTEAARKVGYEVEPVKREGPNHRKCYRDRLLINGKLCRVYYAAVPVSMAPKAHRLYYRISISKSAPLNSDFVIALVGEGPYGIFIFPSKVILDNFGNRPFKMFYIPNEYQAPYNNQLPKIDWWDYEEAWGRLKEE